MGFKVKFLLMQNYSVNIENIEENKIEKIKKKL